MIAWQVMKLWRIAKIARALKTSEKTVKRVISAANLETNKVNGSLCLRNSILVEWLGFDPTRDKVWTIAEVAKQANLCVRTIERTIKEQRLGSVLVSERVRRVRHSQLVDWLGYDPLDEPDTYRPIGQGISLPRKPSEQPSLFDPIDIAS